MFEAICQPHAWKVTGLNMGSHITTTTSTIGFSAITIVLSLCEKKYFDQGVECATPKAG